MSDTSWSIAGGETRQAMIRVWMAISAIWVAFWLGIALVVVGTGVANPFADRLSLFALIVMAPPLALLLLGAGARLTFEFLRQTRVLTGLRRRFSA